VTVALSSLYLGCRVFVRLVGILFPVLKVRWILDVLFEISDSPAVWTEKVWPCRSVQDGTDTLVMPDMRAGRDKQRLAGLCVVLVAKKM
jgi:hypothetical protein